MGLAPEIIQFDSGTAMAARIADAIEAELASGISRSGRATLALSGGSTPAALYAELSKRACDWQHVTGVLVDERWVPPSDDGSNEVFVKRTLRQQAAAHMKLNGFWRSGMKPVQAAAVLNDQFAALNLPLDIVILGMGNDGHTASWFPYAEGLSEALCETAPEVVSIKARESEITGHYLDRLTLSLRTVTAARRIFLLLSGEEKKRTFLAALRDGPTEAMPVRAILRARPDLWVCWSP